MVFLSAKLFDNCVVPLETLSAHKTYWYYRVWPSAGISPRRQFLGGKRRIKSELSIYKKKKYRNTILPQCRTQSEWKAILLMRLTVIDSYHLRALGSSNSLCGQYSCLKEKILNVSAPPYCIKFFNHFTHQILRILETLRKRNCIFVLRIFFYPTVISGKRGRWVSQLMYRFSLKTQKITMVSCF